ncbi:MAG: phosphoribosyltransferase [Thermoplasmata archaeon]|nr:phosphoribosyltransferase [Thermoplasmata archaeon]
MAEYPRCRLTSWADLERWVERIAKEIRAKDQVPDTFVALTRGGWVPARLLADRLGVKRLLALRAQHWGLTATPTGDAELADRLTTPIEGSTVLVVDDITDTGDSLRLAVRHVEELHPRSLESAACLHIGHSKFRPTYIGEEIPRDAWVWVVFPWNYWEDLRSLASKALPEGHDAAGVRGILADRCGLNVPEADVARALAEAGRAA